jgi:hypothetical protein
MRRSGSGRHACSSSAACGQQPRRPLPGAHPCAPAGQGSFRDGADGSDCFIRVPVGTIIRRKEAEVCVVGWRRRGSRARVQTRVRTCGCTLTVWQCVCVCGGGGGGAPRRRCPRPAPRPRGV